LSLATSSAIFIEQLSSAAIQTARNEADKDVDDTRSKQEPPLVITLRHLQQSSMSSIRSFDYSHDTTQQFPQKFEFLKDILEGGYKSIPSYHLIHTKKKATKYIKNNKRKIESDTFVKHIRDDTLLSPLRNTKTIKIEKTLVKSCDSDDVVETRKKESPDSVFSVGLDTVENEVQGTKPYINNIIIQDEEEYD